MYKYTNPDVIRYRRNQQRLVAVSYVLSCLPALFMWAALRDLEKDNKPVENPTTEN